MILLGFIDKGGIEMDAIVKVGKCKKIKKIKWLTIIYYPLPTTQKNK